MDQLWRMLRSCHKAVAHWQDNVLEVKVMETQEFKFSATLEIAVTIFLLALFHKITSIMYV